MIRKFILTVLCLVAVGISFMAVKLMLADDPVRALESMAIRHADKLPLAYLGEKIFERNCASCHDNPATQAPSRTALSGFSKETVMIAMEFGKMQPMAMHLSKREQFLIAIYLTGSGDDGSAWIAQHQCTGQASDDSTEYVGNWGLGIHNQRFVPAASAGIDRTNVGSLKLAWSLGFPKVTDMRSQPAIIGDTLYFGDKSGKLYALDRLRGCVRNNTEVLSGIR